MVGEPSMIARESFRLREETLRVIGVSQADRGTTNHFAAWDFAYSHYWISPCGTDPECWILERAAARGAKPDQLLLFDSKADADVMLGHFVSREARLKSPRAFSDRVGSVESFGKCSSSLFWRASLSDG